MNDSLPLETSGLPRLRRAVLVVDDDEGIRDMLDEWLRQKGFSVWLAATGQEALGIYRRHRATIGAVLMDVCMPDLDGPQTFAALRAISPRICCCFMSGDLGQYTKTELLDLGAAAVIHKPFSLDEVAQLLESLVLPRTVSPGVL